MNDVETSWIRYFADCDFFEFQYFEWLKCRYKSPGRFFPGLCAAGMSSFFDPQQVMGIIFPGNVAAVFADNLERSDVAFQHAKKNLVLGNDFSCNFQCQSQTLRSIAFAAMLLSYFLRIILCNRKIANRFRASKRTAHF